MALTRKKKKRRLKPSQQYTAKRNAQIEEVMDYALQGADYLQIATAMKITMEEVIGLIEDGIRKATHGAISVVHDDALELLRLDRMSQAVARTALTGDKEAIREYERLKKERRALYEKINPRPSFFGSIRVPTGGQGQPPHVRTVETIGIVRAMACAGVDQEIIAASLAISKDTLALHYSEIMENAQGKRTAEWADTLYAAILRKEPGWQSLLVFALKTQGRWSEFEKPYPYRSDSGDPQQSIGGGSAAEPKTEIVITGGLPEDNVDATPLPDVDATDEE